jgi:hypothetical protein
MKTDIWEERPATAYFGVEAVEFLYFRIILNYYGSCVFSS